MNFVLILAAYLVGAIPFALIVARMKGVDLRTVGSGNLGATNVGRALGWTYGVFVLLLDALKGFVPVCFFPQFATVGDGAWNPDVLRVLLAIAAVCGHVFPVYLGFRGGKGVATGLGVSLALLPVASSIALATFLAVAVPTRLVSLGSVVAAAVLPLAFLATDWPRATGPGLVVLIGAVALATVVIVSHRANIGRLLRGEEKRFSVGGRRESEG